MVTNSARQSTGSHRSTRKQIGNNRKSLREVQGNNKASGMHRHQAFRFEYGSGSVLGSRSVVYGQRTSKGLLVCPRLRSSHRCHCYQDDVMDVRIRFMVITSLIY